MMARSRRYERRERPRRNNNWDVSAESKTSQSLAAGKTYQIAQIGPSEDYQVVLERIFGSFYAFGSSASDYQIGIMAGIVLPDITIGSPDFLAEVPGNFPNPADENGTDDWVLFQTLSVATTSSLDWHAEFSSKARRRLKKDDSLWIVWQALTGNLTSVTCGHVIRCLRSFAN